MDHQVHGHTIFQGIEVPGHDKGRRSAQGLQLLGKVFVLGVSVEDVKTLRGASALDGEELKRLVPDGRGPVVVGKHLDQPSTSPIP